MVPAAERPNFLARTWERIREEAGRGRQSYVVCPRIGDGGGGSPAEDPADLAGAERGPGRCGGRGAGGAPRPPIGVLELAAALDENQLSGLRLGVLHGRLPAEEKDQVMLAFADGRVDVLVATTVIEVGVDVPNATVMVIMDADRFGVSQLHQLRGRVGRGGHEGLCLLVTEAPPDSPARVRLDAVASTTDGFKLSEVDLSQRREGDVLGTAQAGRKSSLKLLSVLTDKDLIISARAEAVDLVDADPALADYPALADAVAALVEAEQAEYLEKA